MTNQPSGTNRRDFLKQITALNTLAAVAGVSASRSNDADGEQETKYIYS